MKIVKKTENTMRLFISIANDLVILAFFLIGIFSFKTCADAVKEKVQTTFEYYSKDNPAIPMDRDEMEKKKADNKIIFYIHGWSGENLNKSGSRRWKDKLFETRKDVDIVVLVDWTEASDNWDYFHVAKKTAPKIAKDLKNEVGWLHKEHEISPSDMEMYGHSLGAHIMGQAGKLWNKQGDGPKISKMTALDPAGPFTPLIDSFKDHPDQSIGKDDASFVRGIHTDNKYGLFDDIGHEDIYPYSQDILLDCEAALKEHVCLHRAAKDLGLQELEGATLVDPNDPKRGKERSFSTIDRPLKRSLSITVLTLDVSPSMKDHGRMESMIIATKRHIKSLPLGAYVGIVIFGGYAQISQAPINITDESVRKSVLSKVPSIDTFIWGTSIGAGLQAAIDSFTHLPVLGLRSCPNIILITDGEENRPPWRRDVESRIPKCTRVYPIALGAQADEGLEELSRKTNGQTASASDFDSLDRLTQSLQDSSYAQLDRNLRPIKLPTKTLDVDGQSSVDFLFDKGIGKDTEFFISTTDYNQIRPTLTSPSGDVFDYNDFSVEDYLNARVFNVSFANPGIWNLKVNSADQQHRRKRRSQSDSKTKTVSVFVTTSQRSEDDHPIRLEGRLSSHVIDYTNNSCFIQAKLRKGEDLIIGVHQIEAFLVSSNETIKLTLHDNGVGADEMKDDGVYSRQIVQELAHGVRYEVSIKAMHLETSSVAKIMPAKYISFMPPDSSQQEEFADVYPFERQVGIGSIKATSPYTQIAPSPVKDLQVVSVDPSNIQIGLKWTAAGNSGDFGTADSVEIRATTNYTQVTDYNGEFMFNGSDVVTGSLKPLAAGEMQHVVLGIPEELWNRSSQGLDLYFVLRTTGSNESVSQDSNVASVFYFLDAVEDGSNNFIFISILVAFSVVVSVTSYWFCRKSKYSPVRRR